MKYYRFAIPEGLNISSRDSVLATLNRMFRVQGFVGTAILDVELDDHRSKCTPYILLKYSDDAEIDPTDQFLAWDLKLDVAP